MCGIYGIVSCRLDPGEIKARLRKMGDIQNHRGPDDRKEIIIPLAGGYLGLGFVRLAILDIETGMQPITCRTDNTCIICNGQIYNYLELKGMVKDEPYVTRGDIEVVLHLYRRMGLDFLNHLNGMYAGAIFDPVHGRLLLFRDRFGIKPLYYRIGNNSLVFSSEIKPIIAGGGFRCELNRELLAAFFTYRYTPGEETLFEGIRKLPPGSCMQYDPATGEYRIDRYWEYRPDQVNPDLTIDAAAERFFYLFKDAVRIRLRSDVEVGSLISGGIDSSAVSAQAARFQPDMRLFSIAFEEDKYNELNRVKNFLSGHPSVFSTARLKSQFCAKERLEHLPDIVRSLEEPVSLGTLIPTDQVCEMAAKDLKVVLTGEGADEIFAGYRKFMIEAAASGFRRLAEDKQRRLLDLYPELYTYLAKRAEDPAVRYIQNEALFTADEIRRLIGREIPAGGGPRGAMPALSGKEDPVNAMIALESRFRLPDYVILRLDRLSMRHSLEARTPLLDYRLAEFAATLPVAFKVNLGLDSEKYICRYAYVKYGIVDEDTSSRKKQPFTIPLADWLSDPGTLPEVIQEVLFGDLIRRQGIIDPAFAETFIQRVSDKGVGPETLVSDADRVFAIIIFTLWYQEFFCS